MVIYNGSSVYLRYILWLLCPHCSLRHHLYPFVLKCMWSLKHHVLERWQNLYSCFPDVPKRYLHDPILKWLWFRGVLLSLSVQHWTDWCLSEPMYSPNPWHDSPWDPVCSVCPVVACSFQLSECSTDIPESSGSPATPPLALGHPGGRNPPSQEEGLLNLIYGRKTKDPSFEYRITHLQMISCRWQKSFEHPLGACLFPVSQAWLWGSQWLCPEPREVWAGLGLLSCAHFVCCPVLSVVVGGCIYRSTVGCWVTCSWKWTNIHVRLVRKLVSCSAICLKQIFTHQVFLFYRLP